MKTDFINVNNRQVLLASVVDGSTVRTYFAGSDLFVYQFNNDRLVGYLCTLAAWERSFKSSILDRAANR